MAAVVWAWTAVAAAPGAAFADAQEASLHVEALAGQARIGDPAADAGAQAVAVGGIGLRFTIATHDVFSYDVSASYLHAGSARYESVTVDGVSGDLVRRARAVRASAGLTFRFGARYVPTFGLWAGAQRRFATTGRILDPASGVGLAEIGTAAATDAVAGVRAGFDYRIDRHWIVGVAAGGGIAVATTRGDYAELTALAHVSYYGYPRWF